MFNKSINNQTEIKSSINGNEINWKLIELEFCGVWWRLMLVELAHFLSFSWVMSGDRSSNAAEFHSREKTALSSISSALFVHSLAPAKKGQLVFSCWIGLVLLLHFTIKVLFLLLSLMEWKFITHNSKTIHPQQKKESNNQASPELKRYFNNTWIMVPDESLLPLV